MLTVTLYTKPGCHLCENVKDILANLQASYPHKLVEFDIREDRALFARYHLTIPVVRIGKVELEAPVTAVQLAAALARGEIGA